MDAQDWAEMLLRAYLRWANGRGFAVEVDEVQEGEGAGIKTAVLTVRGRYAYGLLKAEHGVHRLVRLSPFDSAHRRHTSFASVDVIPAIPEGDSEVQIDPKELRIETFRASGPGGQYVNMTDSAVRITHLPSGIVATCQSERSQHQNRRRAMEILRARLAARAREERRREIEALRGEHKEVAFGNQIRSYVLQPYRMVKDHRTGVETSDVERVLDGEFDAFIRAWLEARAAGGSRSASATMRETSVTHGNRET